MSELLVALDARVSSEEQSAAHTIESQLAALRERIVADGLHLTEEGAFLDEGFSGAPLVRPALERLRDLAAPLRGGPTLCPGTGSPRGANMPIKCCSGIEFKRAGVEVIFLDHGFGQTPQDELLVQVQGMVAEYERAKILERGRRGKRHAALAGSVSVLGQAPYGYRSVPKGAGGGQARYEIVLEEARVVRQMFDWVGRERLEPGRSCPSPDAGGGPKPYGQAPLGPEHGVD